MLTLEKLRTVFNRIFLCRTYAAEQWCDAIDSEFSIAGRCAGGSPKHSTWSQNQRFVLHTPPGCDEVFVVLSQPGKFAYMHNKINSSQNRFWTGFI